ncbi:MAG: leucine-rich repeat protein, partial [Muribaculaceae bacterium]|nr:leucine-rich repeat protein [Muribaculaceae bacterium]
MKKKIYLIVLALISLLSVHAQNSLSETLFSETFSNVNETSKQLIPADMSKFDNPTEWILDKVYAGEKCLHLSEGSSITFPSVKDIIGNGMFEIDAEPWIIEPDFDNENFDWEAFEEGQMKAGAYHMSIENGELLTTDFDLKMSMNGQPCMYDISPDTRLTLHADGPLIINAIHIGYGNVSQWTDKTEFNPAPGVYYGPFDLLITPGKSGDGFSERGEHNYAVFTTDGTCPDRRSQKVDGPIHIDKTTTVWVATIHGNGMMTLSDPKQYEIQGNTNVEKPNFTYEINVDKPGTLKNKILEIDADEINGLEIHGKINGEDLSYINSGNGRMGFLTYLNLADVTFEYDETLYKQRVFAPEGGMGTVTTIYYYLSETNYEKNLGGGRPGVENYAYYRNDLSSAFVGHPKLELIVLPDFMTSIGSSAFENCESLVQVKHNGKLTEIGASAFYNCKNLNNIDLSSTIRVGYSAFARTNIRGEVDFSTIDEFGDASFADTKISSIKFGTPSYIGKSAFAGTLLKRLDLPNPPDTIPEMAFDCYNSDTYERPLKTVALGEGVRYLGKNAFGNGVEEMNLPSTLEELEENALPVKIVANIEPEDGIKYIGKVAYSRDSDRSSYTIKEGTVSLSPQLFYFSNVESVTLPSSLRIIGEQAFYGTKLKKTPDMPNVRIIKDNAFANCKDLARAVLPESLEIIGGGIFDYCNSLWYIEYNAKDIQYEYYLNLPNVEKIVLGDNVRRIPSGLFTYNTNITEVRLPESVEIIDESAFCLCKNLEYIYMPDNVTTIGDNAFGGCEKLADFHWPANLKTIGFGAYRECKSLKTISLPEGVEFVDYGAFQECTGIESVY